MFPKVEPNLIRTSPEQQGLASTAVLEFIQALDSQIQELHSFMLLRHGCILAEGWWSPYKREHSHMLFSLSKSFTSTAVGLAVAEGYFSIDDPVLPFFPEQAPTEASDFLALMCVRHLLTMTTGHTEDTWSTMSERQDGNWIKAFFDVPLSHPPGTHFLYNTGATYILAAIVQKTTGMKLVEYLTPRLFEPLSIENATWQESPQGIALGGIGLSLKTEDIARFGQLYLQKGIWQGKQILPEAWITEATSHQISTGESMYDDWSQGYGYQFWRCQHGAYRGDGVFGQYCIVMPEQGVVLAMTGGMDVFDMQRPLDLIWELLLPAVGTEPLAEDAVSHQRLTEKLSGLALHPVQGQAASSISAQASGQAYKADVNEMGIETIALHFSDSGCTVSLKTAEDEEIIPCGYGMWQPGQTRLFQGSWVSGITPTYATGAWTANDTFMMVIRLYETPFFHTLVFHFDEDEIIIETWVNASLESTNKLLLTAHRM